MKKLAIIFILFIYAGLIVNAQTSYKYRYVNTVFSETEATKNIEYANAPWLNNPVPEFADYNIHEDELPTESRPLLMDIYQPLGDTVSKRPVILFMHGGGFLLGSRGNDDMVALCDSFAKKGYVTANIQYRLGMGADVVRTGGVITSLTVNESNANRAVYRGIQDGRAAIRYLKKNADTYGIDTNNVFLVGSSAGGFVSIHNAYLNLASEIPSDAQTSPDLGGLDQIGERGNFGAQANAIVPFWAAIHSTDLIVDEDIPTLLIHGTADQTVPFDDGQPLTNIIPSNPVVLLNTPITYGSYCIDTALTNRGINHETYFVNGEDHEFYGVENGDFGDDGPNEYWDTVIWKTQDFLYRQNKPVADFVELALSDNEISFKDSSQNAVYREWDFGDGTYSNEDSLSHKYTKNGTFKVLYYVMNYNNSWDTASTLITINYAGSTFDVTFNINNGVDSIEGATVILSGFGTQTTDANGDAVFAGVIPSDDIDYFVSADQYYDYQGKLTVVDENVTTSIKMQIHTRQVGFSVDDGQTALSGALISIDNYDIEETDKFGVALFDSIEITKNIVYSITNEGYYEVVDSFVVVKSDTSISVSMDIMSYDVTFTIDDGTNPVEGADVELGTYKSKLTDNNGIVVFNNIIPASNVPYTVTKIKYNTFSETITIDGDESINVTLELTTGYDDLDNQQINVYPNPSRGAFNIDNGQNTLVKVYNVIGKQVYSKTLTSRHDQVDISNLPDGIYIIQMVGGVKDTRIKVMKNSK